MNKTIPEVFTKAQPKSVVASYYISEDVLHPVKALMGKIKKDKQCWAEFIATNYEPRQKLLWPQQLLVICKYLGNPIMDDDE